MMSIRRHEPVIVAALLTSLHVALCVNGSFDGLINVDRVKYFRFTNSNESRFGIYL
jgi:hypothetical protein